MLPVLVDVCARDDVQRLIGAKRIGVMHADSIAGGRLRDASGPFGNRAGSVPGAFGAERSQILFESRGLIGRNCGEQAGGRGSQRCENERRQAQADGCMRMRVHGLEVFLECELSGVQNEYFIVAET